LSESPTGDILEPNTDVHSCFVAGQVLKKLLRTYEGDKMEGQQAVTEKKAKLIYDAVEAFPEIYKIIADKSARSRVNICFRVAKGGDASAAEKAFLEQSTAQGLTGLKGHRSIGGM
jgi:phosphoserine aminotransferase